MRPMATAPAMSALNMDESPVNPSQEKPADW
jgi:hypothetical protein